MGLGHAQFRDLNVVEFERLNEEFADRDALIPGQDDRFASHDKFAVGVEAVVSSRGRRVFVIVGDVLTMFARTPTARVAAQPCAVGGSDAMVPIVPGLAGHGANDSLWLGYAKAQGLNPWAWGGGMILCLEG
jgi:hypothetical protein